VSAGALERLLRRDRLVAAAALGTVCFASWACVVAMALHGMRSPLHWSAGAAVGMFFMWAMMMVAMMLPAAAPTMLLYARVLRRNFGAAHPGTRLTCFAAGYIAIWSAFSLVAVALQFALESAGWMSRDMIFTDAALSGTVLLGAALYQLTPAKRACLAHCRSPVMFLSRRWRDGALGALAMGLIHGVYCLGCCWLLMALLFAGGVMNLVAVAALTLLVLVEKVAPAGERISRLAAAPLGAFALWMLFAA